MPACAFIRRSRLGDRSTELPVGIVDFRTLLIEAGYNVVFRTVEWTDCFVSSSSEKWHGYGLSEDDALRDTLRQMIPSNLGRFLLEHEIAQDRLPELSGSAPSQSPASTVAPSARGLVSLASALHAAHSPSATLVSQGLEQNGSHADPPLAEGVTHSAVAEQLASLLVPERADAWPSVDTATRANGLPVLGADVDPRSLDIQDGKSPLACEPELPDAVGPQPLGEGRETSETSAILSAAQADVDRAPGPEPGHDASVGDVSGEPAAESPSTAAEAAGVEVEPADASPTPPRPESVENSPAADATHGDPNADKPSGETPEDAGPSKKAGRGRASGGAAKVAATGDTRCGVLHSKNDDAFAVLRDHGLFIVADGLEANSAGHVASRMAIEVIQKTFETKTATPASRQGLPFLVAAIQRANAKVFGAGRQEPKLRGMGTTIAVAMTLGKRVALAHIGDSRIYRLRAGVLELLTTDHSVVNEQIRMGEQADLRATGAPRAQLTRALGTRPTVETDTSVVAARPGDTMLLCTDGVHALLKHEALTEILTKPSTPDELVAQLLERVTAAGRPDNATAVVVRWDGSETS